MKKNNWMILAVSAHGQGISGGDRIWIEFVRRWSKMVHITLVVWEEGFWMCQRQKLTQISNRTFQVLNFQKWNWLGFGVSYVFRVLGAVKWSLKTEIDTYQVVYSSSEFWMDIFPAVIFKIRNKKIRWIVSWYQTAPNPMIGFSTVSSVRRYRFKAVLYWLVQQVSKWFIIRHADYILVNNEEEKDTFPSFKKSDQIAVVFGAVDKKKIDSYHIPPAKHKLYDAVFQGRFHPQKGVEELIDIWKLVCLKNPIAKLVMIGDGPLMNKVKQKIEQNKLNKNIILKGYLFDGKEKYRIFSQSKIVVHPALYDSGGMASGEAMVFGLPVVGFDLPSYKTYYPKGMIKVPVGNLNNFAQTCLVLCNNSQIRKKIGMSGKNFIIHYRQWDQISQEIFEKISKRLV